jgi:hypothetical protein
MEAGQGLPKVKEKEVASPNPSPWDSVSKDDPYPEQQIPITYWYVFPI